MALAPTNTGFPPARVPVNLISRPRLLQLIDAGADLPLTLVAAGAGWGKSVLLSDWARRQPSPPVWLSLSPQNSHPERFWKMFGRAVTPGDAGASEPASPLTAADVLDALARQGPTATGRVTIVLDDAHFLVDLDTIDALDLILRTMDDRVRLVVAARFDPLLPVHRYRLDGLMAEVRAAGLAMTEAETEALLDAHGIRLPPGRAAELTARTEGWVAGLKLSALRMERSPTPEAFIDQFALDQGSIGEYLVTEVLDRMPPRVRQMLIETSFLDELPESAVAHITGNAQAHDDLLHLSRTNSFITALDVRASRFRVHQLMREILGYLFSGLHPPQRRRELYRRAADWFLAQHEAAASLGYALLAGDPDTVCSTLLGGALASAYASPSCRQELAALDFTEAAAAFTDPSRSDDPRSTTALWAIAALDPDRDNAERALGTMPDRAEWPTSGTEQQRATRQLALLMLAERLGAHDLVIEAATYLEGLLDGALAGVPGLGAMILLAGARARHNLGQSEHLDETIAEAVRRAQADDAPGAEIEIQAFRAAIDAFEIRFRHADRALDRARDLLAAHPEMLRSASLDVPLARRAFVRGDRPALEQAARRLRDRDSAWSSADLSAAAAIAEARSLVAAGRLADARALLAEDPDLGRRRGTDVYTVARDGELADIHTRLGRAHAALRLLDRYSDTPLQPLTAPATARAHLALGQPAAARQQARSVMNAGQHVNRFLVVEAMLCQAAADLMEGAEAESVEGLESAIEVAGGDIVEPFRSAAAGFRALLDRHPALAAAWPGGPPHPDAEADATPAPESAPLPDPLTERERAVLRLLCTNLSANDIANQLFVSIHTVRTHQASIYRKLSAGKRRDAVRRARVLELI